MPQERMRYHCVKTSPLAIPAKEEKQTRGKPLVQVRSPQEAARTIADTISSHTYSTTLHDLYILIPHVRDTHAQAASNGLRTSFKAEYLRTTTTYTDSNGKTIEVPMSLTRLTEDAVPTMFPNSPAYLSDCAPVRKEPDAKRKHREADQLLTGIQMSLVSHEEEERKNRVASFEQLVSQLSQLKLSDYWIVSSTEAAVMFLHIQRNTLPPEVERSVVVSDELHISAYWKKMTLHIADVPIPEKLEDIRSLYTILERLLTTKTHSALRLTSYSLIEVSRYCLEELGFEYVLLAKFQTDSLEERFGRYRRLCGSNYHISVQQIFESEAKLRLQNSLVFPDMKELSQPSSIVFDAAKVIEEYGIKLTEEDVKSKKESLPAIVYIAGMRTPKEDDDFELTGRSGVPMAAVPRSYELRSNVVLDDSAYMYDELSKEDFGDIALSVKRTQEAPYYSHSEATNSLSFPDLPGHFDISGNLKYFVPQGPHKVSPRFPEENASVVLVDWSKGCGSVLGYSTAAANTRTVARTLALLVKTLVDAGAVALERVHYIGHSLGAQTGGFFGKDVKQLTGRLVGRITGLDPAGPLFESYGVHLTADDADFVDVLHTSVGTGWTDVVQGRLGMFKSCGHVDFYPNGGKQQPGCWKFSPCSHSKATEYYADSVRLCNFPTRSCKSYDDFLAGTCASSCADGRTCGHMGHPASLPLTGNHFTKTSKEQCAFKPRRIQARTQVLMRSMDPDEMLINSLGRSAKILLEEAEPRERRELLDALREEMAVRTGQRSGYMDQPLN
ncbi:hypothetical protein HPB51_007913 [Rhipicephalus microplus]|uniref:Lipase domain-containing protein n=1 Tax=Rhipicephalus microplus TaxID=6941 RepID=A0A9J6ENK3_RHIMP|nr:hypothetical protein HPB51_007913 [Rhipicephalus microplus]